MLVAFICKGDLNSANSNVLWVTAEAIPRVKNEGEFLETSRELIERLTREGVVHEVQDHETDLEKLRESTGEMIRYNGHMIFITPEAERYQSFLNGSEVIEVGISRVMDIPKWRKIGHKKSFPDVKSEGYRLFLDTVSFTGMTIDEIDRHYDIQAAGIELVGKYAIENIHNNIRIPLVRARNVPDFDGVWHLDDFVQNIETQNGFIKPSEFVGTVSGKLREAKSRKDFERMLIETGIKTEQTSPNLFLELSRPNSYLARSLCPEGVEGAIDLIKSMEDQYRSKNGS